MLPPSAMQSDHHSQQYMHSMAKSYHPQQSFSQHPFSISSIMNVTDQQSKEMRLYQEAFHVPYYTPIQTPQQAPGMSHSTAPSTISHYTGPLYAPTSEASAATDNLPSYSVPASGELSHQQHTSAQYLSSLSNLSSATDVGKMPQHDNYFINAESSPANNSTQHPQPPQEQ